MPWAVPYAFFTISLFSREGGRLLLFALFVPEGFLAALALFRRLFLLALDAWLFEKSAPPHFGEDAVFLDLLVKSFESSLKWFVFIDDNLGQIPRPPSLADFPPRELYSGR